MDFQTLNSLMQLTRGFTHTKVKSVGLNDTESVICSYVYAHENCSQDEVANGLCMDKTTVAKAVLQLEKKGMLTRTRDERDRRRNNLRNTDAGTKACNEIYNIHSEWVEKLMGTLDAGEKAQFEAYCIRIVEAAKQIIEDENDCVIKL